MFDTSLVRHRHVNPSRRFGLFAVSVALHTTVAVAAIAMSVAAVEFPSHAPRQMQILRPVASVSLPPPLGTGGAPRPRPKAAAVPVKREIPRQVTAPQEIPEEIPLPTTTTTTATTALEPGSGDPSTVDGEGDGDGGHPGGTPDGLGDDPGAIAGPSGGIHIPGGEVRAARVLRRVEPQYPRALASTRMSAIVTVRCIIDHNGRIRNPEITRSSYPPFNQSVIDAVKQWTFAPGTMRGQPVDTWFELTVTFQVR
jgi:TonB family protein